MGRWVVLRKEERVRVYRFCLLSSAFWGGGIAGSAGQEAAQGRRQRDMHLT